MLISISPDEWRNRIYQPFLQRTPILEAGTRRLVANATLHTSGPFFELETADNIVQSLDDGTGIAGKFNLRRIQSADE